MIEPLLLPSQEGLVERLTHNIYYAEQLQLLSGASGSGKSFLLKQLNQNLDGSVVFMSSPLHADDAEIRRKLLLPLLSEPVFDDEVSLSDSLVSFSASLQQPITILIDDAHRLSMALWAELIALSQMTISERHISIIAAVTPEFEQQIFESLPESYQSLLTSLYLEPLIQQEQDALYYSLLSRSDGFENHLIAKPDFNGVTVYPKDIVSVFVASNDEQVEKVIKKSNLKALILALPIIVSVLGLSWFYQTQILNFLFDGEKSVAEPTVVAKKSTLQLPIKDAEDVFKRAEVERIESERTKPQTIVVGGESKANELEPLITQELVQEEPLQKSHETVVRKPQVEDVTPKQAETSQTEVIMAVKGHKPVTVPVVVETKPAPEPVVVVEKPKIQRPNPESYTLQIATVSKKRSLNNLLKQLKDQEGVRVGKNNSRWVVVIGAFENYRKAKAFEKKLLAETKISKPWIRKWKALNKLELQNLDKISEN